MNKIKTTITANYNFHASTEAFAAAAVIRDARAIFGARLKIEWDGPNFGIEGVGDINHNRLGVDLFERIGWAVRTLCEGADHPGLAIDLKSGTVSYSEGF